MTFNELWKLFLKTNDPNEFKRIPELLELWELRTFHEILFSTHKDHINFFFREYNYEILDKICDICVSTVFDELILVLDDMIKVISYIGTATRPKELYILVLEKLITVEVNCSHYITLELLLFALQRAIIPLISEKNFLISGIHICDC